MKSTNTQVRRNGSAARATKQAPKPIPNKPAVAPAESVAWRPCDTDMLAREALMILGASGTSPLREELHRDLAERLFVTRFDMKRPQLKTVIREVGYSEACDWLGKRSGSPEKRLALHGIVRREPTSNKPALERELTCLSLFDDGVESAGLDLSDAEVVELEASAKRAGESMGDFLESAIKGKLAANAKAANGNPSSEPIKDEFSSTELEHAIDQAHALTAQEQTPSKSSGADLPAAAGNLPPLKRKSVISAKRPDLEEALHYAVGLLELFAEMAGAVTQRGGRDHDGAICCGLMNWGYDLARVLHADCYAAYDAAKGGDKVAAYRRLGVTIGKVRALLLMLAHSLSSGGQFNAYEGAQMSVGLPDDELSPFLSLAADCIEYLEASFYDEFGRHLPMNSIDREFEEEFLQKLAQPAQERTAA